VTSSNGDIAGEPRLSTIIGSLPNREAFNVQRGVNALGGALAARDITATLTIGNSTSSYSGRFGGQARVSPSYNLLNDESTTGSSCDLPTSETALLCGSGSLEFNDTNCPAYTGAAIQRSDSISASFNCGLSRVHQFKPSGTASITGSKQTGIEDTVYLEGDRSAYSLSGDGGVCSRSLCYISGTGVSITARNIEVLVFADREIRL
jgi:hypothetical protein